MWALWFFPLIVLLILIGLGLGLFRHLTNRANRSLVDRRIVAAPFGFAALLAFGLPLLAITGSLIQKSDAQLYEEVFGYRTTISADRMLFDNFGSGEDREIYMRAQPTTAERARLLAIPGLQKSEFSLDQFAARGAQQGFTWWVATSPPDDEGFCQSARIFDAAGFRGWKEFRIAECIDAGTQFPASANFGRVYVIASGRSE